MALEAIEQCTQHPMSNLCVYHKTCVSSCLIRGYILVGTTRVQDQFGYIWPPQAIILSNLQITSTLEHFQQGRGTSDTLSKAEHFENLSANYNSAVIAAPRNHN